MPVISIWCGTVGSLTPQNRGSAKGKNFWSIDLAIESAILTSNRCQLTSPHCLVATILSTSHWLGYVGWELSQVVWFTTSNTARSILVDSVQNPNTQHGIYHRGNRIYWIWTPSSMATSRTRGSRISLGWTRRNQIPFSMLESSIQ